MIISPPFLPLTDSASELMDWADRREQLHGIYPICYDRRWHGGCHLTPEYQNDPVRAIADGEVVAYRVCQHLEGHEGGVRDTNTGFVLLRHETDTGEGRTLRYYSLYMHLRHLGGYGGNCDPARLPDWLRMPTEAKAGKGKRVRRKEILGWTGRCDGAMYLHFEIFMTKVDFEVYFKGTQLGQAAPTTPSGTDYWGNSYYVVPKGTPILPQPPGTIRNKLKGIDFPLLKGIAATERDLYIEVCFHLGQKITRVWRDNGNGARTLLTTTPIKETDYEYNMHQRASSLYPACPSDGYELLRFGRILSQPPTLPSAARTTWFRVAFDENAEGYVDVNDPRIQKLSDADFPMFAGWKTVREATVPFTQDGLCDIESLKALLKKDKPEHNPYMGTSADKALRYYVHMGDDVRRKLRGFICEMPSEWDGMNNDARYRKIKEPGEFYAGDETGYGRFMELRERCQFWDKTGLPPTTSDRLWFFHPLSFIRHFRKCAWLSPNEFGQVYPNKAYPKIDMESLRAEYLMHLNSATRKFGITTPTRLAHFLGQGAVESAHLTQMQELSMTGDLKPAGFYGSELNRLSRSRESDLGHWYGEHPTEDDPWYRSTKFNSKGTRIASSYDWRNGNCDFEDAQKFRGRGFKQLTGRSNYADYWVFRGWNSEDFSRSWWTDPAFKARNRGGMKLKPIVINNPQQVALPKNCIDSGAFYMRFSRPNVFIHIDKDKAFLALSAADISAERRTSTAVTVAINGGKLAEVERLKFTRAAKLILG